MRGPRQPPAAAARGNAAPGARPAAASGGRCAGQRGAGCTARGSLRRPGPLLYLAARVRHALDAGDALELVAAGRQDARGAVELRVVGAWRVAACVAPLAPRRAPAGGAPAGGARAPLHEQLAAAALRVLRDAGAAARGEARADARAELDALRALLRPTMPPPSVVAQLSPPRSGGRTRRRRARRRAREARHGAPARVRLRRRPATGPAC